MTEQAEMLRRHGACFLAAAFLSLALLVGMSGTSHWSASAEAVPGEAALLFDIACRVKQTPVNLGSCYRSSAGGAWDCREGQPAIELDAVALQFVVAEADNTTRLRLDTATRRELAISPDLVAEAAFPRTERWRYRLALRQS